MFPTFVIHAFFISNALISNNWLKLKQKLSNTLGLNLCDLKYVHFHPRYQPKTVGDTLKKCAKTIVSVLIKLYD